MVSLKSHMLSPSEHVPLFIAAGVLKQSSHLEPFLATEDPRQVPILTLGSFTLTHCKGNASLDHPVDFIYYEEGQAAGNARGLPNGGVEGMRALAPYIRALSEIGVRTILSVTNLPNERALDVIPNMVEAAAELRPTAVEVNLSCPNGLKSDGSLHPPVCNDAEASGEVMQASRTRVGADVCLGAKDSPHVTSPEDSLDEPGIVRLFMAINPSVDFVTGVNTLGGQSFPEITSTGGKAGMSGPIIKDVAHTWLRIARTSAADHVALLSCGGVDTANIAFELPYRRQLGALLVGGAQEFYRRGQPHSVAAEWTRTVGRTH